jgi:hypothetical protein
VVFKAMVMIAAPMESHAKRVRFADSIGILAGVVQTIESAVKRHYHIRCG